jgi:hypothetical protein
MKAPTALGHSNSPSHFRHSGLPTKPHHPSHSVMNLSCSSWNSRPCRGPKKALLSPPDPKYSPHHRDS